MKKLIFILVAVALVFSACKKSEEVDVYNPSTDGVMGEWYSSGANVAVLLKTYFKVDSIYAKFNENNTYLVESFASGTKTTYSGTYAQTKSGTGSIWNVVLNQSTPTAVTSEGIFEITDKKTSFTMKYEVVQTQPTIAATPPTPAAGFGSSSGGVLGTMNVQNFIKFTK